MQKEIDMRAVAQNFKGIEYVQISSLPVDQKKLIWNSINHTLIIMILKDDHLLNDCLQYRDYSNWYDSIYKVQVQQEKIILKSSEPSFWLALK